MPDHTVRRTGGARPAGLVVAGASLDTGNMGVSALCESTVTEMAARLPGAAICVLDDGRGIRDASVEGQAGAVPIRLIAAPYSRRHYRSDTWLRIRIAARLGGLANAAARTMLASAAILDASGGDSFSDIYGMWRFRNVMQSKEFALENRIPLVLLPQTYGPFSTDRARRDAARVVRGAGLAWARDERSFAVLRELLGGSFDPARHRSGVDVAFLLHRRPPAAAPAGDVGAWLDPASRVPVIGLNVSGLLFNDPATARRQYGLRADYAEVLRGLLGHLLDDSDARVVLVPHVLVPKGHFESDFDACEALAATVSAEQRGRVRVLPPQYGASELKWFISRMTWFCGTRMHSMIAALSSGVPVGAVSYSPKTLGVFETCGQGGHVADPTVLDTDDVVRRLVESWRSRDASRAALARDLPRVLDAARRQFDLIAEFCGGAVPAKAGRAAESDG